MIARSAPACSLMPRTAATPAAGSSSEILIFTALNPASRAAITASTCSAGLRRCANEA